MAKYRIELPGSGTYEVEHENEDLSQDQVLEVLAKTLQSSTPRSQAAGISGELNSLNAEGAGIASAITRMAAGVGKFLPKSLAKYLPNADDANVAEGLQEGNPWARGGGVVTDMAATAGPAGAIYKGTANALTRVAPRVPDLLRGLTAAGVSGGAVGAVTDPNSAAHGAKVGAAAGMAGEGLARGVARLVRGVVPTSQDAKVLMDQNIQPSVGQAADKNTLTGRVVSSIENTVGKVPVVGTPVRNAQARAIDEWRERVLQQAGGRAVPPASADLPMPARVQGMMDDASAGYERELGGIRFRVAPVRSRLIGEANRLSSAHRLNDAEDRTLLSVIGDEITGRFPKHGDMIPAADLKRFKSESFNRSFHPNTTVRETEALRDLGTSADTMLHRSIPTDRSEAIQGLDNSWAALEKIKTAVKRASSSHGDFSPAQLADVVSRGNGGSVIDGLASSGAKVLKAPSYEYGRGMDPTSPQMASFAAASSVLSPRWLNKVLTGNTETQRIVADHLRKLVPAGRLSFMEMASQPGEENVP